MNKSTYTLISDARTCIMDKNYTGAYRTLVGVEEKVQEKDRVIEELQKAVENLLPGAKHISADVGLINDALVSSRKAIN